MKVRGQLGVLVLSFVPYMDVWDLIQVIRHVQKVPLPTNSSAESCIPTLCESLHCFSTKELCFMENESCVGILFNYLFDFVNRYSLVMSKELWLLKRALDI